jgi:oligopeptidase B
VARDSRRAGTGGGAQLLRARRLSVSPDGRYLAWNADTNGSERFLLHVKDLEHDMLIDEPVPDTLASPVWSADGRHFFYVVVNDAVAALPGAPAQARHPRDDDPVVYEEPDESFFVGIDQTTSEHSYVLISPATTSPARSATCRPTTPTPEPRLVAARRTGHEYSMDHGEGRFYFMSNAAHKNFALLRAPEKSPEEAHWETLLAGSDEQYLKWFARFRGRLVIGERIDGLEQVRIIEDGGDDYLIEFPGADPHRLAWAPTPSTTRGAARALPVHGDAGDRVRLSLRRPPPRSAEDPAHPHRLRARQRYVTERLTATARDGARVPVSIVYRKDLPRDGSAPLYLYGYGAYGMATMPGFSANRLSLLDRGFAFAIAHIRGGDDLGYAWYEDGKLDKRTNTFNDFVDVARFLIAEGYTSAGRIAIAGGSAGGELMGAVVNQAPELWGAVVAHVPFMDVLNTMLDVSLPLTPIEWPEWGNPITDKEAFASTSFLLALRSADARRLPAHAGHRRPQRPARHLLGTGQVRGEAAHPEDRRQLAAAEDQHGRRAPGQSGRFESLQELAEEYAFILVSLKMV